MAILSWTRKPLGIMVVRMIEEYVKLMAGWAGMDENIMSRMAHVAHLLPKPRAVDVTGTWTVSEEYAGFLGVPHVVDRGASKH